MCMLRGDCIKAHFGGILESDWRAINKNKIAYLKVQSEILLLWFLFFHSVDGSRLRWFRLVCPIIPPRCPVQFVRHPVDPVTRVPSPYPTTSSPTPPPTIPVLLYMGSYDFTMISRWNYLSGADYSFLRCQNSTSLKCYFYRSDDKVQRVFFIGHNTQLAGLLSWYEIRVRY